MARGTGSHGTGGAQTANSILTEERRNAAFLVVLSGLCCLWVFQGAQLLERGTERRQDKLARLWELRQESRRMPADAGPRHLRPLDGLFAGYRVVLRREAAGPLMCLQPTGGEEKR